MARPQVPTLALSATLRVRTIDSTIVTLASQVGEVFLLPLEHLQQRKMSRTPSTGALPANVGQLRIRQRLTEESRAVVANNKRRQWFLLFMTPLFGQPM